MNNTATEIDWSLRLNSSPRQVFCALVGTASAQGRLIRVDGFGTSLVFASEQSAPRRCTPLRATVSSSHQGTLLHFSPVGSAGGPDDIAAQAASVGSLIRQLRERSRSIAVKPWMAMSRDT